MPLVLVRTQIYLRPEMFTRIVRCLQAESYEE